MDEIRSKFELSEAHVPRSWYTNQGDLGEPVPPVLHPGTALPIGADDLAPIFPMGLIEQEFARERAVAIPEPVRDIYRLWRRSPLARARRLAKALDKPAKIYFKCEGVSPTGSHKPNTALPEAYFNKMAGIARLSTETGAGQWGSSLAFAGALLGDDARARWLESLRRVAGSYHALGAAR